MGIVRPDQSSSGGGGGGSVTVTDGTHSVANVTTLDFTAGVTVSDAGGGQANASVTAGAPTFTPTATKTANYTAAAGEYVVGDSTAGAFTVTLPAAPANGTLVAVQQIGSANAITVAAGVGDTINATTNSSLGTTRRSALYEYRASDKVWFALAPATNPVLSAGAFDGSIVAHGSAIAPTFSTGTLDAIATAQPPSAAVPLNAQKITGIAVATVATDAASLANSLDQFAVPAANVAFNAKKITGLAAATAATDAASLANTLDQFGAPAADVSWNSKKLTAAASVAISGLTGAVNASRLAGAITTAPPTSGTFLLGDTVVDQNGGMFVCTVAGTPGTWAPVGMAPPPAFVAPIVGYQPTSQGLIGANTAKGVRVVIPRTGTLHDLSVYIGAQSGNVDIGVYDTTVTTRNRLYHSGAIACPAANAWRIIGDPSLAVTAGQQVDFVLAADNGSVQIARDVQSGLVAACQLPTGFLASPLGGLPITSWFIGSSYPLPATLTEASLQQDSGHVMIIGRIT